ncbi:rCG23293 [Rattus norvegicus]|uniref:RCG23293 n=1 Tax=Rattus norvegicus TaxID=10116 RepID=A6JQC0_RAT|nr:rCG23293 [Rattus norvegicus]
MSLYPGSEALPVEPTFKEHISRIMGAGAFWRAETETRCWTGRRGLQAESWPKQKRGMELAYSGSLCDSFMKS